MKEPKKEQVNSAYVRGYLNSTQDISLAVPSKPGVLSTVLGDMMECVSLGTQISEKLFRCTEYKGAIRIRKITSKYDVPAFLFWDAKPKKTALHPGTTENISI